MFEVGSCKAVVWVWKIIQFDKACEAFYFILRGRDSDCPCLDIVHLYTPSVDDKSQETHFKYTLLTLTKSRFSRTQSTKDGPQDTDIEQITKNGI